MNFVCLGFVIFTKIYVQVMITGLIIGAVIGGAVLSIAAIWYTQKQIESENLLDEKYEEENYLPLDIPVEKKLRDALYESERGEMKCIEEISKIIELQTDLLDGLGKPTYVELKGKDLFFVINNPLNSEKRYYYYRDIENNIEEVIIRDTLKLLKLYDEHIELFLSKLNLFKKLSDSHRENLNKINGIHKQHEQLLKLKKHKGKIAEMEERTDLEIRAIKNESVLEDIERELEFQKECLKTYSQITAEMDRPINIEISSDLKYKIEKIIEDIDKEDT